MNYKDRLKNLREKEKLTQEELATKINLTRGAYKQYELQYDIIPLVHLNSLCNYFNASIDYILKLTDKKQYQNSQKKFEKDKLSIRIKELRKNRNIKQEIFAKNLNTNQSIISDLENGKKFISTTLLYTICIKYNISADYLLGKIDKPKNLK